MSSCCGGNGEINEIRETFKEQSNKYQWKENNMLWMFTSIFKGIKPKIQSMDVPAEAETVYDRRPIDHDMEYASLQDALDTYGITEVSSPAWLPDGYTLNDIDVIYLADSDFLYINAEYTCEDQVMHFEIVDYTAGPIVQVEKTSAPVELFEIDGIDVYLFENINNSAASWLTDHFECHITGVVDVETLKHVVLSIYSK